MASNVIPFPARSVKRLPNAANDNDLPPAPLVAAVWRKAA